MRRFSFRPTFTFRGRQFKGLRGWAGKPLHPPLTDIPVAAYVFVAAFDLISALGHEQEWARDFYRAGSFVLIVGAAVSVLTALTGFWDWLKSTEPGTQVRRTANAHMLTMVTMTVLVLTNVALRVFVYWDEPSTTGLVLALSLVVAGLVTGGAALGGALAFEYGFNVETAGDHPAWHRSEVDVLPGHRDGENHADGIDLTSKAADAEVHSRVDV
jgi:uncharacterized membrane protein